MPYIERVPATAQDPTPKKISGPKPSNVVADFISREQWKAAFRAVALAKDYTKTEILLAGALADNFYCKTGKCDPGYEKLAAEINAGLRTVKLAAKTLEADGWCSRKRGGRDENVNFTLSIPFGISAAMPAPMEDVTDVSNADSISAENGHFSGSISANTAAPLNTEVEQRRAGLYGPRSSGVEIQSLPNHTATAADAAAQKPALETDIPEQEREGTKALRLCSDRVEEKDQAETHTLNASFCPIRMPAANGAALDRRNGHAARRPETEPHNEVTKIMEDAIKGAGFLLRKLTPAESQRLARHSEMFAKVRRNYTNQPAADADEVEALFNRMLLDVHSFVPFVKTYGGLMSDLNEGRIAVEDIPTLKTLLAENWQRVHESGRRTQRAQPIEAACVAA
jgi:hypothetical protein